MQTNLYAEAVKSILTFNRALRKFSNRVHAEEISGRQLAALRYLQENENCTVGKLAAYLFISESSTSELLSKLENKGLVKRTRLSRDKRVVTVTVTSSGKKMVRKIPMGGIVLLREQLKVMSEKDLKSINRIIGMLNEVLEKEE